MYDRFLLNDFTTENGIMESVDQYFADNFLSDPSSCNSDSLSLQSSPCDEDVGVGVWQCLCDGIDLQFK